MTFVGAYDRLTSSACRNLFLSTAIVRPGLQHFTGDMRRLLQCWLPASTRFQRSAVDPADTEALQRLCLSPPNQALLGTMKPFLNKLNEEALLLLKYGGVLSGMKKLCESQNNSQDELDRALVSGRKYGEVLCR